MIEDFGEVSVHPLINFGARVRFGQTIFSY
jgi:hypothetical protein